MEEPFGLNCASMTRASPDGNTATASPVLTNELRGGFNLAPSTFVETQKLSSYLVNSTTSASVLLFSSPIWGEHEVRKLHADLVELDWLATQAAASHRR